VGEKNAPHLKAGPGFENGAFSLQAMAWSASSQAGPHCRWGLGLQPHQPAA
jgi:hypothetical protein